MCISINFKAKCHTNIHQKVYIAGSIPEFGLWDITQSFPLITTTEIYPLWQGNICVNVEPQQIIQFKLVLVSPQGNCWEYIDNREVQICYQYQSLHLSFNIPHQRLVKVKSFIESSDEEELILEKVKKRRLRTQPSPLEEQQFSSDSEDESDITSIFTSVRSLSATPISSQISNENEFEGFFSLGVSKF